MSYQMEGMLIMKRFGVLAVVLGLLMAGTAWGHNDGTRNVLFEVKGLTEQTAKSLEQKLSSIAGVQSALVSAKKGAVSLTFGEGAKVRWSDVVGAVNSAGDGHVIGKVQALVSRQLVIHVKGLGDGEDQKLAQRIESHPSVAKVTSQGSGVFDITFNPHKAVQFSELPKPVKMVNAQAEITDVVFHGPPPKKASPKPG